MFKNQIQRKRGHAKSRCYYGPGQNDTFNLVGAPGSYGGGVDSSGTGGGGSSFDPNTFNWGGAIQGAGQGLGGLLAGIGALVHGGGYTPPGNQGGAGYNNNNNSGSNQPPKTPPSTGLSVATIVMAVVLIILILIVTFLALKKTKAA